MKFLRKNALTILSVYALVMLGILFALWDSFSIIQRFTIGFLALITLHEWEEIRFPGGYTEMMGKIMNTDFSKAPEGALHLPTIIQIVVLTMLPLLFPGVASLFLAVMYLGLYEGVIHLLAIKLAHRKKPYTPGMITAIVLFVYSLFGIYSGVSMGLFDPIDWLLAFVVFFSGLLIMEFSIYRLMHVKPADVLKGKKAKPKKMRG